MILDDEESIIQALGRMLRNKGYKVIGCMLPAEALDRLKEDGVDLLISDLRMPHMTGIEFLAKARQSCPSAATILLVDPADRELALAANNQGTVDWYVEKPWDEEIMEITVASAINYQKVLKENKRLQNLISKQDKFISSLET